MLAVSINEMPVPDTLFVLIEISYKMHYIIVLGWLKYEEFVNRL